MNFNVSSRGLLPAREWTLSTTTLTAADDGSPVKLTGNMTVGLCSDGDPIFGVVTRVESGACAVKVQGTIEMPYTGTDPEVGPGQLAANGAGGVKVVTPDNTGAFNFTIVAVDTAEKIVTFNLTV